MIHFRNQSAALPLATRPAGAAAMDCRPPASAVLCLEHVVAQHRDATSSRIVAYAAIALGSLLAVGALLADVLGIGGGGEGIGWKQLIAAIAGIVIALSGLAFLLKPGGLISGE
jgi:hypothetical protein